VTDAPVTTSTRPAALIASFALLPCKWHPVQTLDPVRSFAVPGVAAHLEDNEAAVEAAQVPHGQTRYLNKMTKARGWQKDSSR
jgi:hypothetical protein